MAAFVNEEAVRNALISKFPDISVRAQELTGSTNSDMKRAYASGQEAGPAVLIARIQTKGRGSHGRAWNGMKESILFSLGLPAPQSRYLSPVSLIAGFSAARAFRQEDVPVAIKWPNDLWLSGGKMGGILVEAVKTPSGLAVVSGIGINLELEPGAGKQMAYPVAALGDVLPIKSEARDLRTKWIGRLSRGILTDVKSYFSTLQMPDWNQWKELDFLNGKRISADDNAGTVIHGFCEGIDQDGALVLRMDDGLERHLVSATIRLEERK